MDVPSLHKRCQTLEVSVPALHRHHPRNWTADTAISPLALGQTWPFWTPHLCPDRVPFCRPVQTQTSGHCIPYRLSTISSQDTEPGVFSILVPYVERHSKMTYLNTDRLELVIPQHWLIRVGQTSTLTDSSWSNLNVDWCELVKFAFTPPPHPITHPWSHPWQILNLGFLQSWFHMLKHTPRWHRCSLWHKTPENRKENCGKKCLQILKDYRSLRSTFAWC